MDITQRMWSELDAITDKIWALAGAQWLELWPVD